MEPRVQQGGTSPEAFLHRVRVETLERFRPVVLGLSLPAGLVFLSAELLGEAASPFVIVGLVVLLIMCAGLWLAPSYEGRALSLSFGLSAIVIMIFFHWGVALGVGMIAAGATMAATFMHGRRGAFLTVPLFTLMLSVGAFAEAQGWLQLRVSLPDLLGWTRAHVLTLLCLGGISFTLLRIQAAMGVALRAESLARADQELAEQEREQALEAAMQGQRLEAAGRLASGVAHDFNNALLVLQGTI